MKARELVTMFDSLPPEDDVFFHTIVENRWRGYESIWTDMLEFETTLEKNLVVVSLKEDEWV